MKIIFYIISLILVFSTGIVAQMPDMSYYQLLNPNYEIGSEEDAMKKMQALFIQQIFVQPLFKSTSVIEIEEDAIYDTKQSNELMNVIYARQLSKYLADQDLLYLDEYFRE